MKIKITIQDTFSFAYDIKLVDYTEKKYNQFNDIMKNKSIIRQFDNNIAWFWIIKKVEII